MYILKNSIKNIYQNRWINLLIGIIIITIIISTVVAFSINSATDKIIENYREYFGYEVSVQLDINKITEFKESGKDIPEIDPPSNELHIKLAESEYIKDSIISTKILATSETIELIDEDKKFRGDIVGNIVYDGYISKEIYGDRLIRVIGLYNEGGKSNAIQITKGEYTEEYNECIISKDLAELNYVKIGDMIELEVQDVIIPDKELRLKVTGIYVNLNKSYDNMYSDKPILKNKNDIYTTIDTIFLLDKDHPVNAQYHLKSTQLLENFEREAKELGLPEFYKITTNEEAYNRVVNPFEELSSNVTIFIAVVLLLGSATIILINSFFIRDRKYEIGVLRFMGMKKNKIIVGFIIEILILTSICLFIGGGIGSIVVKPVSNILLEKRLQSQKQDDMLNGMLITTEQEKEQNIEIISELNAKIDMNSLLKAIGISLLLVLFSSIVVVRYITKYQPIKILTERGEEICRY